MCSSDSHSASRFARGLAFGLAISIAAAIIPSILVDPTGHLAQRWPDKPQVCAPGMRANPRRAKFLVEEIVRPREVLLGTSRVFYGFASVDVTSRLAAPALNMGLPGATVAEIEVALQRSIATGRLQRAWIGLDYGMFSRGTQVQVQAQQEGSTLSDAVLDSDSIRSAYAALLDPQRCATPPIDRLGFPVEAHLFASIDDRGWDGLTRRSRFSIERDFRRVSVRNVTLTESVVNAQWAALHRSIARAKQTGVEVVLFVNPSHRYYSEAIAQVGLKRSFLEWRRELARYAQQEKLPLFDWSDYPVTLQTNLEACNPVHDDRCPLYDVDHYRPQVGRTMLDSMLRQLRHPTVAAYRHGLD